MYNKEKMERKKTNSNKNSNKINMKSEKNCMSVYILIQH